MAFGDIWGYLSDERNCVIKGKQLEMDTSSLKEREREDPSGRSKGEKIRKGKRGDFSNQSHS